ncbi:MAG: NADH-dependent [FeFe] hydrogenase, group A6 [Defluviitaleaceae bacterium]|nr:NADH-dependent [FeFe] hydrogenase, group A6 [Defluviitaleaceae bacterium]MCL2835655.1 NADH-dependent [FeFe] hydrogenase, group A6 [Defluviitaleaceae bacterium]
MINLTIDGKKVSVPAGSTILEAARKADVNVPTLCYMKGVNEIGACRICLIEVKGGRVLLAACVAPANEGMEVYTNSPKVREARKSNLELILSEHDRSCLTCVRNLNCELQAIARDLNIEELPFEGKRIEHEIDDLSPSIVRDNNKCILCRRCIGMCKNIQETAVIDAQNRGILTKIGCAFDASLDEIACVMCGQCINVCPTGALYEKDHINRVWDALSCPDTHVVVQTAPAVRVALGEEFGMPIGTSVTGQMVHALKRLGFDKVFDTNTAADITIMEEGTELIDRVRNNGTLPLFTSCSPGWVKYLESYHPEFIPNLSSCKSPHQKFGALIKSYYAEKAGIDPKNIYVVSVMPCSAKKYEIQRPEMSVDGLRDVDAVLTTRELARMIKTARLNWNSLCSCNDSDCICAFDNPFGEASGAGAIFGVTGGVTEAALRTVAELLTGKRAEDIEFTDTRGKDGIKEYTVRLPEITLKGAVVSGTANAKKMLEKIKNGEEYHFIEFMGCPGGCIMGGGQPIVDALAAAECDVFALRAKAIYGVDKSLPVRRSHENPFIKKLYEEIGEPGGDRAHQLFHTAYAAKEKYPAELHI